MMHHRGHYEASYIPQSDYVQQLQEQLERCRSLVATQEAELVQLRRDCSRLNSYYEEYRQANETLLREHNGLSLQLENTTNLSNARGKELAGAQAFLSKADNISVVELRDLIDTLNEEIFQTAAFLGDCIVRRKYGLSDKDQLSYIKRLRPIAGKGLLQMLSAQNATESNSRNVNPLLVQVVVQVLLVDRCKYEVDGWDPNHPDLSKSLTELYRGMRVSAQQTVFGRWRALTLSQIKTDLEPWRRDVLENFRRLLEVACWDIPSSQLDAFRNRLGSIFKTVQQLRQAIGQDIISEDYKLYTVPPEKTFRAIGMEEAYGDSEKQSSGGSREPGIVLGTTALGLMKLTFASDVPQDYVVLPKVVVDTSFGDIFTIHSSSERFSSRHQHDGRD